jgi:hypothetical protein
VLGEGHALRLEELGGRGLGNVRRLGHTRKFI